MRCGNDVSDGLQPRGSTLFWMGEMPHLPRKLYNASPEETRLTMNTSRRIRVVSWALVLFCLSLGAVHGDDATGFRSVTGPCRFSFPEDHGAHPGYRTEWWYYTGNLEAETGNRYGFQLTFFRSQITAPADEKRWPHPPSAWRTHQIYLGHAAVSDISGRHHLCSHT